MRFIARMLRRNHPKLQSYFTKQMEVTISLFGCCRDTAGLVQVFQVPLSAVVIDLALRHEQHGAN